MSQLAEARQPGLGALNAMAEEGTCPVSVVVDSARVVMRSAQSSGSEAPVVGAFRRPHDVALAWFVVDSADDIRGAGWEQRTWGTTGLMRCRSCRGTWPNTGESPRWGRELEGLSFFVPAGDVMGDVGKASQWEA